MKRSDLGEFWPKETAGLGWVTRAEGWPVPLPHMVLGGELPLELGGPQGPTELSPSPLRTVGLWAVFWLGSAPTLLLTM